MNPGINSRGIFQRKIQYAAVLHMSQAFIPLLNDHVFDAYIEGESFNLGPVIVEDP